MAVLTRDDLDARAQIEACARDYCRGLDRRDWALFDRIFHDDATCRLSEIGGPWRDWLAQAKALLTQATDVTHHQIGRSLITLAGDTAFSETYVTAYHLVRADAPPGGMLGGTGAPYEAIIGARYVDTCERRQGVWRIAERRSVPAWRRYQAVHAV